MASVDDNNEEAPTSAQPEAKEAVANGKASPSSSQTQVAAEVQSPNDGPASSPSSAIHQNNGSETDLGDTSMSSEACVENPKEPIEDFRWEDLEDRYQKRMQGCEETEAALYEEFQNWMKVFENWASVTTLHENERSVKRLRTRINYVQGSERDLEEKRQHYINVVRAFESALALLGPSS